MPYTSQPLDKGRTTGLKVSGMFTRSCRILVMLLVFTTCAFTAFGQVGGLVLSPSSVNFGSIAVGSTSSFLIVTATNQGKQPAMYLGEQGLDDFTFDPGTCGPISTGTMLAPGKSCNFSVAFHPASAVKFTGSFTVGAQASPTTFRLSGTGAAVQCQQDAVCGVDRVGTPTAQPALIQTFQPTTVTISAAVAGTSLVAGNVVLQQFHTDPTTGVRDFDATVAMYDDGTHGDVTAGDGTYTAQLSVGASAHAQFLFRVEAQYATPSGGLSSVSDFAEVIVAAPLTAQDYNLMSSTVASADSQFGSFISAGSSQAVAQAKTIAWLAQQPGVNAVGPSASGSPNIWIVFTSGMNAVLSEADLDTTRGGGSSLRNSYSTAKMSPLLDASIIQTADVTIPPVSASVVRESPFNTNPFTNADESYLDEAGLISAQLQQSKCSYPVTPYVNSDANLNSFTNLASAGIVLISGHGDAYFQDYLKYVVPHSPHLVIHPSYDYAHEHWTEAQAVIYTRQAPSSDDVGKPNYQLAFELGQIVYVYVHDGTILGVPVPAARFYGITPDFIRAYYHPSPSLHAVVYAGTCESLINDTSMANAFVGNGANSYFGYTGIVETKFAARTGYQLFVKQLLKGLSTSRALAALSGNSDPANEATNQDHPGQTSLQLYQTPNTDVRLPDCVLADFIFNDGEPGNLTITINGVAHNFPSLQFNESVSLGFAELPAGRTYNMQVLANGGFADYTINLPKGYAFSDGTTTKSNHIISFSGPNSYTFTSAGPATTSTKQVQAAAKPKIF